MTNKTLHQESNIGIEVRDVKYKACKRHLGNVDVIFEVVNRLGDRYFIYQDCLN